MIENYSNVRAVLNELRLALKTCEKRVRHIQFILRKQGSQRKNKWKY